MKRSRQLTEWRSNIMKTVAAEVVRGYMFLSCVTEDTGLPDGAPPLRHQGLILLPVLLFPLLIFN